jgi:signal transduction histidine kinase
LALLLWAGIRFGVVGVSVSLLLLAAPVLWGASHGLGPLAEQSPADAVLDLQLFLIEVGVLVMLVAALVEERQGIVRTLGERNEEARSLAGKLITAQERERTRIARELHDEIGQSLTVVKINLGTMRLTQDATAQAQLVDEGVALVEQAIEQVRDLSQLLRPAILEHLGLEAALRWLVKAQAQRLQYQASFTADELPAPPPPVVEITCYRVLQEALTNVARHSRARNVSVDLRVANGLLRLTIRDDGEGFDLATMRQHARHGASIGLQSLDERARLANGRLVIVTAIGQGTTLTLTLPYPGEAPTQT